MPAPNTPLLPHTMSQLAAQVVLERFSNRPALFSVVVNALRQRILQRYPTLELDLLKAELASPDPSGGWTYTLLANVAVMHVLNPQLLDFSPRREQPFYLTQDRSSRLDTPVAPSVDMQVIAQILDELPSAIHLYFQQEMADYWSEPDAQGNSRWQWLAGFLNGQMTAAAAGRPDLPETQRDMLSLIASRPQRQRRVSVAGPETNAYFIETTLERGGQQARLLTPDLLLVRDKQVLLYGVAGTVEAFDTTDAFGDAWGARLQEKFQFDSLTWRRNEPDGNVFEQQAGLILNQQLEDLKNLNYQGQSEEELERRLEKITNPALVFSDLNQAAPARLQKVKEQLPEWLRQADATDRFAYHRLLQDTAQVMKQSAGHSFNQGIENVHSFSRDALRAQMHKDHEADDVVDPDDVELNFAVAAGYPGGAGIISHVRMTLTELAVKNLAGKPSGTLTLSSRSGKSLAAWLDADYLLGSTGLIQRVDIGTTYPQKIKDLLLSDTTDARRREKLFIRELKVQLPMRALEYKIRKHNGVSDKGYRYIAALLADSPPDRMVDGQEIVLRPLALCRKAGATPDAASNIFIIEPRDASVGPHLLYRPLYAESLHEYPTRQALLDAIAAPGELQDSVLTWLTDKARPIYDNDGIKEPHIIHFLSGDEFTRRDKPAPAFLAIDEGAEEWLQSQVNGQLLMHLFGSTARALVDLADRASVSNSESRWAILMEGAWLLFNTLLLPLVRGPAMLAGWFLVLVSSLEQDLAGLNSDDPTTRELALIDLLLNTAMVLLHSTQPSNRPRSRLSEPAPEEIALHLESWLRPAGSAHQQGLPVVHQGASAFPGEPPATGNTALDFSRSIASPKASADLLNALLSVHVPWPETLPSPMASGPFKGLYRIGDTWHATVGGLLFQVSIEPGFGDVHLVDPKRPHHPGFRLAGDGQGHWRLDRRARLEGGMPRERLSAWQKKQDNHLKVLRSEFQRLRTESQELFGPAKTSQDALNVARANLNRQKEQLRQVWKLLGNALPALQERVAARHAQVQLDTVRAKIALDIAFENYQKTGEAFNAVMQRYADKAAELMATDRTNPAFRQSRDIAVKVIYDYWGSVYEVLTLNFVDTFETGRGESVSALRERVRTELPQHITDAYNEHIESEKSSFDVLKQTIEPAEKIETILKQADPILREALLKDRPTDQYISSAIAKQHALLILVELVLDRSSDTREPAEWPFITEFIDANLTSSILAHSEMRTTTGYSTAEQMDVLKNVLERYERLENAVNSLSDMGSAYLREEYRTPFLDQLSEARASLEAHLADLILVDEGFASAPAPDSTIRMKQPSKKVFKTRNKGSLVGDLRPRQPENPGNFVDIKDPLSGQIVATYHEHASEGVWVEVVTATPPEPAPVPAVRSLKTIKEHAENILGQRAGIERRIRDQQKKLQDPSRREELSPLDWDDMLTQHADKLKALVNELNRDHPANADTPALEKTWLDEADAVTTLARAVCSEGYKQQRPKASNVAYLWKHGFVDINLVKSRVPTKAGDYLTEYAVREKNTTNVLWYAHFHYPAMDTHASSPSFGHLKTKAERLFTRKELIDQARANNRVLVNLEKAEIALPLAQQLFLNLEPPLPKADG